MVGLIAAAAVAVSSQVSDVTVYNDRAQVVRTAEVQLEQGINTLRFEDLPEAINSRGIQVDGSGAATVLDVRFKTENFEQIPEEAWKALYDQRDELQELEKAVEQQAQRLRQLEDFLSRISDKVTHRAETEGQQELNPESWDQMLSLYVEKGAEYDEAIQAAEQELKEIRKSLQKVNADIEDTGADIRKQRRVVEVDLDAANSGKAEVRLSYLVSGPGWKPVYDVRVDTQSREMEVKYFGLVRQNTGENWSNVALKLSTANPSLGGKHPDIQPWRIRARPDMVPRGGSGVDFYSASSSSYAPVPETSAMANTFVTDELSDSSLTDIQPMEVRSAVARKQGASVLFEVKGKSSVDSDNVEHRVAVSVVKLPAHFRYSAVPKMDKHAYLKAKAVNRSKSPFLAGKANVFLDGSYVATSALELVAPEEEFWVFLGVDESMKVEYKLITKFTSREGFAGKTVRHTREYLLTVENTHSVAEEVIVWDQIPVSGNEKIEVDLIEPKYSKDTESLKIDEEKRIQWFSKLKPGQKWEIPLVFRVDAPDGVKISGLE